MIRLLIFFLLSLPALAQKTVFVKDAATNKGIPYVSVFTIDGTLKINTESDGNFNVPDEFLRNTFVFDAVGYESKQQELTDVVLLEPKSELLEELVITPRLGTREINVGKIDKKKNVNMIFSEKSSLQGSKFEIQDKKCRFIKEIFIRTNSKIDNAKFEIKVYGSNDNGEPDELINEVPIIFTAKKGKKISSVNVEDLKLYIDSEYFFIIFDQLYIEENSRIEEWDGKMIKVYEPRVGITTSNDCFTWFCSLNSEKKWHKAEILTDPDYHKEKYYNYQIKVTLTN